MSEWHSDCMYHRCMELSGSTAMDVSTDLQELSRCPVAVVSCGVKSILDIGRYVDCLDSVVSLHIDSASQDIGISGRIFHVQ